MTAQGMGAVTALARWPTQRQIGRISRKLERTNFHPFSIAAYGTLTQFMLGKSASVCTKREQKDRQLISNGTLTRF
jgi:hypothetical protein